MRQAAILLISIVSGAACAGDLPSLVCTESKTVQVDPKAFVAQQIESTTIYKFKSGELYLAPIDRSEYLYNKVEETEPGRYVSGHKTIIFDDAHPVTFTSALVVHSNDQEVRITRVRCVHP